MFVITDRPNLLHKGHSRNNSQNLPLDIKGFMSVRGKNRKTTIDPGHWGRDPKMIERARICLVLFLSKQPPGEVVRIIMDWLDDADLYDFCHRHLNDRDLAWIEQRD